MVENEHLNNFFDNTIFLIKEMKFKPTTFALEKDLSVSWFNKLLKNRPLSTRFETMCKIAELLDTDITIMISAKLSSQKNDDKKA